MSDSLPGAVPRSEAEATPTASTTVSVQGTPFVPPERQATWPRLDGFEIVAEIGRGGMGVVYRAWQPSLQRWVALKMILAGEQAGKSQLERFEAEAKVVAQLQHPNIVQLYDVGVHDSQPYFFMEFVDGCSLQKKLSGTPQPVEEAARVTEILARAVQTAHEKGIVHRDLKPANVLLDAQGTLKITDFGLAKRLDSDSLQTQTGAILGTPSYMAPEQAEGRSQTASPTTDVYSLGAMLYEMLTGRPPFRGAAVLETLEQVRTLDPVPPRDLRPGIPRDLETICLNCLQKEAGRRYATALALAEDLRRYLDGEAILARPAGVVGRLTRTLGRSRLGEEFHPWSNLLFQFAIVALVAHLILHYAYCTRLPIILIIAIDCAQFTLMGLSLWIARSQRRSPVLPEEHRLWLQGIGYLMNCALVRFINNAQAVGSESVYEMRDYPYFSVLAALLFFLMGGTYWGRCYLFSAAFVIVAMLATFWPSSAVLAFGIAWSACLLNLGLHVRRLAST